MLQLEYIFRDDGLIYLKRMSNSVIEDPECLILDEFIEIFKIKKVELSGTKIRFATICFEKVDYSINNDIRFEGTVHFKIPVCMISLESREKLKKNYDKLIFNCPVFFRKIPTENSIDYLGYLEAELKKEYDAQLTNEAVKKFFTDLEIVDQELYMNNWQIRSFLKQISEPDDLTIVETGVKNIQIILNLNKNALLEKKVMTNTMLMIHPTLWY